MENISVNRNFFSDNRLQKFLIVTALDADQKYGK